MESVFFWIFSILMLVFGLGVVVLRNPVASAMCLVASFLFLASLFVTLDAFFIGVVQVLVYAGAVMVLFLFIIMLLDLKAERRRRLNLGVFFGGSLVLLGFVAVLAQVLRATPYFRVTKPALLDSGLGDVASIGATLFSSYNLPFQVVGVLLLVATMGVVVLSRKELK